MLDPLDDTAMIDLDKQIKALVKRGGKAGISVAEIQGELGDLAVIRAGILTSKNVLRLIGGGGDKNYIVAIADLKTPPQSNQEEKLNGTNR